MTKREFLDIVFALAPTEANKIMDAFDEYVESNEPHWIPVTERLPERSGDYLVTRDIIEVYEPEVCDIDYFDADTLNWDGYGNLVIAWMPKPEPFKGVTE